MVVFVVTTVGERKGWVMGGSYRALKEWSIQYIHLVVCIWVSYRCPYSYKIYNIFYNCYSAFQ